MSTPTPLTEPAGAELAPEPEHGRLPQSRWFIPLMIAAFFAAQLTFNASASVSLPLRFGQLDPAGKAGWLSLAVALGGIANVLITPPLGWLSDITTSRFGIRRPYLVFGALAGTLGMLIIASAGSPAVVVIGWCVAQLGFAAGPVALNALLADQIAPGVRARVSAGLGAAQGLSSFAGGFLISVLPADPAFWFLTPAALVVVLNIALAAVLRDIVRTERPRISIKPLLASYWVNPLAHRDFALAWFCRLFFTLSMFSVLAYLLYFMQSSLGVSEADAATTVGTALLVQTLGGALTIFVFGWLSDRTGRRKLMVCGSALISAVGLAICIPATSLTTFFLGIAIVGMGNGAYTSVDLALMTEVLPEDIGAGQGLGVVALAYQLPQFLAPALAVPILALSGGDYRGLYAAAVVFAVLGALAVLPIRSAR